MRLLKDILKSKTGKEVKYSQGRVYLFIAFISYIVFLGFLTYKMIRCDFSVEIGPADTIISALQWILALLAGYVFGAKGLEALKIISGKSPKEEGVPEEKKPKSLLNEQKKEQEKKYEGQKPEDAGDGPSI